jgi:hypothetical protein
MKSDGTAASGAPPPVLPSLVIASPESSRWVQIGAALLQSLVEAAWETRKVPNPVSATCFRPGSLAVGSSRLAL